LKIKKKHYVALSSQTPVASTHSYCSTWWPKYTCMGLWSPSVCLSVACIWFTENQNSYKLQFYWRPCRPRATGTLTGLSTEWLDMCKFGQNLLWL